VKIHNDPSSTWPKVVNVTDFDGKFEAKGVPSMGGNSAGDLAKKLKALKPPKRPAQPPKPKLQDVELLLLFLLLLLKLAELSVDRNLVDLLTYIYIHIHIQYDYNYTSKCEVDLPSFCRPRLVQEFKATMPQYSEECLDYQDPLSLDLRC
jgi:hypothetical protein